MLANAPTAGAPTEKGFAGGYLPFCVRRRQQAVSQAETELAHEPVRAARLGRLREIVFGAQDGAISTTMVALTLIGSGADAGTVVFAGIATAAAGIVSMSAGAWLGSKAERDVREACISDKRRQVAEQPLVERSKLARILEQEGNDPAAAWQQASRAAPPDLCRALLEKQYGISETAPVGSPWRDAATMGAAFGTAALAPVAPLLCGISHPAAPAAAGIAVLAALGLGKAWVLNRRQALRQSLEITAVGIASAAGGYGLGWLLEQGAARMGMGIVSSFSRRTSASMRRPYGHGNRARQLSR